MWLAEPKSYPEPLATREIGGGGKFMATIVSEGKYKEIGIYIEHASPQYLLLK